MSINIKGKFIHNGMFFAKCPKCGKEIVEIKEGEQKDIKCKCGHVFVKVNNNVRDHK